MTTSTSFPAGVAIVLVHGSGHDNRCWAPTIHELELLVPHVSILAVDLPGRGAGGQRHASSVDELARSVVEQTDAAGLERVLLVGHSLAGITLPRVAARLGAERTAGVVYIAATSPPDGGSALDTLPTPLRQVVRLSSSGDRVATLPWPVARWGFTNGMTPEQRSLVRRCLVPEALSLNRITVNRGDMTTVPSAWVLTLRDRAAPPTRQHRSMGLLGGVDIVVELNAPHDAMISHPANSRTRY